MNIDPRLPPFLRAELALALEPLIAAEMRQRMVEGGGQTGRINVSDPSRTLDELGKRSGTSASTILRVKRILAKATPGVLNDLRTGALTINHAYTSLGYAAGNRKPEGKEGIAAELTRILREFQKQRKDNHDARALVRWAPEKIVVATQRQTMNWLETELDRLISHLHAAASSKPARRATARSAHQKEGPHAQQNAGAIIAPDIGDFVDFPPGDPNARGTTH